MWPKYLKIPSLSFFQRQVDNKVSIDVRVVPDVIGKLILPTQVLVERSARQVVLCAS